MKFSICLNAFRCMTPEYDGVKDMREDVSVILTWYYAYQTTVSVHDDKVTRETVSCSRPSVV